MRLDNPPRVSHVPPPRRATTDHTPPQSRAPAQNKAIHLANLTWLRGYVATWRSSPRAGAKRSQLPTRQCDQTRPNATSQQNATFRPPILTPEPSTNRRRTAAHRCAPFPANSNSAKQSQLPKWQSLAPPSSSPRSRAGAKRTHFCAIATQKG